MNRFIYRFFQPVYSSASEINSELHGKIKEMHFCMNQESHKLLLSTNKTDLFFLLRICERNYSHLS